MKSVLLNKGRTFVLTLESGENIKSEIEGFCKEQKISSAKITILGGWKLVLLLFVDQSWSMVIRPNASFLLNIQLMHRPKWLLSVQCSQMKREIP